MAAEEPQARPGWADVAAWFAVVAVVVIGLIVVIVPGFHDLDLGDPYDPHRVEVKTVVKTDASGKSTTEKTTTQKPKPLIELALARGGLLLLRLAVVVAAAFVAGAVVQRAVLGNFAFEAGGVKVPPLVSDATETAAAAANRALEAAETLADEMSDLTRRVDTLTSRRAGRTT